MYKLVCNEFGFDCNFVIKNSNKNTIANNFCKHLLDNHDQYYPTKEVFEFIEKQDTINNKNYEESNSNKLFHGRRNFP